MRPPLIEGAERFDTRTDAATRRTAIRLHDALLALVVHLGEAEATLPPDLHTQVREALDDSFYYAVPRED